jgi:hypothetical protein
MRARTAQTKEEEGQERHKREGQALGGGGGVVVGMDLM